MTGTVELDQGGQHLLIRFPYREDLVAMVKELPGRRWDPKQKVWRVPSEHAKDVYEACARHLFEFTSDVASLLAGTLAQPSTDATAAGDQPPRQGLLLPTGDEPTSAADDVTSQDALSISELNERVKRSVTGAFPENFWVVGEVVDFDKSANRAHRFFQLAEKMPRAPRPKAVVSVAMFERTAAQLLPALAQGEPPLTLRDGLEIRALVRADFYPATGRFQLIVHDIDPSFTLGKLALTKEQILRELAERGLTERNRMLGVPVPAKRIGVLTSPDADGWNDFRRHLEESDCGFDVTLYPIKVQGVDLKPTLLAGLRWFAARRERFDVVCIMRGGGSRTDLAWFDDRDVAIAVAQLPLKVLVGIGHQRDQSVLDVIAQSEKTPTAVAESLVRGVEAAREDVQERSQQLATLVADRLQDEQDRLREQTRAIAQASRQRVQDAQRRIIEASRGLQSATTLRIARERGNLRHEAARLVLLSQRCCERAATKLQQAETRRRLLDPARVLQRGYAIVRDPGGRIAPSASQISKDQPLRLQFRDGHADVTVDEVEKDPS
ncbi:MAG: exodeoxyribonuclease VII large subunit [Planctomycetota bacterium]|nr:exodeoxyribonuclease VII large subunit [Planctomycetota bacterium]